MSVNWEEAAKRYVVRFRDVDGRHRTVTVNAKNLDKYGLSIPTRITERVANCQSNLKQWGTLTSQRPCPTGREKPPGWPTSKGLKKDAYQSEQ